jgi:RNA polymerase sigma factor (sigma-70 family)
MAISSIPPVRRMQPSGVSSLRRPVLQQYRSDEIVSAAPTIDSPFLGARDELLLVIQFQQAYDALASGVEGDEREDLVQSQNDAMIRLLESQKGAIRREAERYSKNNPYFITQEELESAGAIGLFEALIRFDVSKRYRLMTYASHYIRNSMSKEVIRSKWMMGISDYFYKKVIKQNKSRSELSISIGREPTIGELSSFMGENIDDVSRVSLWEGRDVISMDLNINKGRDLSRWEAILGSYNYVSEESKSQDAIFWQEIGARLDEIMLLKLTSKERRVLSLKYQMCRGECGEYSCPAEPGRELSFQEIGSELGISGEGARVLHNKALAKLARVGSVMVLHGELS